MESSFPAIGHVYLRDLENKETILLNTEDPSVREHIKSQSKQHEDRMISLCKKHQGKYLKIHTTDDYLNIIVKFFVKQHNPKLKGRK